MLIRLSLMCVLCIGSFSAYAQDPLRSALAAGQGFAYVLNQQAEIQISPDFGKIGKKIVSLTAQYAKTPKSKRAASIQIALTALVGGVSQASNTALLGKFHSQCLVMPTSLFKANDAKRMGIYKLAYDFIQTKDSFNYRLFLLCEPGVNDPQWLRLLSFPKNGFNFYRHKDKYTTYWYFINKAGDIAFYF